MTKIDPVLYTKDKTEQVKYMHTQKSHEYINEFLYFVIRPDESRGKDTFIYCSGVNSIRFVPITKGRHGMGPSPAIRGLQLVNSGVRALALEKGVTIKPVRGNDCAGVVPAQEGWYREILLIENAPGSFPEEVINYGVINLLKKIFKACTLQDAMPEKLLAPDELQAFIESLCNKYQGNFDLRDVGEK